MFEYENCSCERLKTAKSIENAKKKLLQQNGLMLDGKSVEKEALESISEALTIGMKIANEKNKKYSPKATSKKHRFDAISNAN